MLILNSMTRASPETKLILLLLLVHRQNYGMDAQSKALITSNSVGITRSQINTGYCYLVDEGYLWEVKTVAKCQQTGKRKPESIYGLTAASIELWFQSVNQMMWKDDFFFLLSNKLGGKFQKLANNDVQTTDCLLVLIALLTYANPAKYVCGCDTRILSQMLGLSEVRIRRAILALAKSGMVSIAAQGVGDSKMFGQLAPIYQIHSVPTNMKIISVGVFVHTILIPFKFIDDLSEFYKKMKKNAAKSRLCNAKQDSGLSNEMYYELAKMITGKRIKDSIFHLCLSTIFSLVPWHAEALIALDSQEPKKESLSQLFTALQNQVYYTLAGVLFRNIFAWQEYSQTNFVQDQLSTSDALALMRLQTLDVLTRELSSIIQGLSSQWKVFVEGQGIKQPKLVGYLPDALMNVYPKRDNERTDSQVSTALEDAQKNLSNWRIACVLTAYVPNAEKYDHCAVMKDELWVFNTSISGKRIRHIKRMMCTNGKTVIFDKSG